MTTKTPIYQRGEAWYVRIPIGNGKYKHRSLGTSSQKEAIEKARSLLSVGSGGADQLFDDAAVQFTAFMLKSRKLATASMYKSAMLKMAGYLEGKKILQITRHDISDIQNRMLTEGMAPSSISVYMVVLSMLFRFAGKDGDGRIHNPVEDLARSAAFRDDRLHLPDARTRHLSETEEHELLGYLSRDKKNKSSSVMHDCIVFAIDTGLRVSEQCKLLIDHIDLDKKELMVIAANSKSGKSRKVPLLPRAFEIATRLSSGRKGSDRLFMEAGKVMRADTLRDRLQRASEAMSIKDVRWHDLRRTCGCRLLQGGPNTFGHRLQIKSVSVWLGHSNSAITEKSYAFLGVDDLHKQIGTFNEQGATE